MTGAATLTKIARLCREHGDEDMREHGAGIERFLAGDHDSLDRALGLSLGRGQRKPETLLALAERDQLIRDCARIHYYAHKDSAAAELITADWRRYASTGWRAEADCDEVPKHREGKPAAFFWLMLRANDSVLSARTIRLILARK